MLMDPDIKTHRRTSACASLRVIGGGVLSGRGRDHAHIYHRKTNHRLCGDSLSLCDMHFAEHKYCLYARCIAYYVRNRLSNRIFVVYRIMHMSWAARAFIRRYIIIAAIGRRRRREGVPHRESLRSPLHDDTQVVAVAVVAVILLCCDVLALGVVSVFLLGKVHTVFCVDWCRAHWRLNTETDQQNLIGTFSMRHLIVIGTIRTIENQIK